MIEPDDLDKLINKGYLSLQMPGTLCKDAISLAGRFYGQPLLQRLELAANKAEANFLGYLPSEQDVNRFKLDFPTFTGDRRRGYSSFDFIEDPHAFSPSGLNCTNMWPKDAGLVQDIQQLNRELCSFTTQIAKQLLQITESALGSELSADGLNGVTCSMTRFLHYEKTPDEQVSKAHTDYEFLAIIISEQAGLEVERADGPWLQVPWSETECVVLPGDMFAIASKGKIRATRHRVRFGPVERLSVVCFQGLKYDTPISYPGRASKVPFGEHICAMKIRGTPHLERALNDRSLKLTFDIPDKNPLGPPLTTDRVS